MALCPVCEAEIQLGNDTVEGELVTCPDCGVELEVTSVNPIELTEAPQEEEDWGQ